MVKSLQKLNNLTKNLKYKFVNKDLLILALTHSSHQEINNQRLEYLGDAILNFVIAEHLYILQPHSKEGDLTRIRANLVKKSTLAIIAKGLLIQDYIFLGIGEKKTGGCNKDSILADTIEAIIGAIYLDSDFITIKNLIISWFANFEEYQKLTSVNKDSKTVLQELIQAKGLNLPKYEIIKITGKPHNQVFQVKCLINDLNLYQEVFGIGSNRKQAEQDAAKKALELFNDENDD